MDLSSLSTTLQTPSSSDARLDAETALTRDFRAAALVLTQFYKSSLSTSNQAYSAGYKACLEEIQGHIQASLSVPHGDDRENAGRTLGRLMDWIEARQEAFKLQAEDEQEDQQREQAHRSKRDASTSAGATSQQRARTAEPSSSRAPSPSNDAMEGSTGSLASEPVKPSVRSRQRDALVEAVNRARSRGTPDVDEVASAPATADDDTTTRVQETPTSSAMPPHMLSSPLHSPANSHRMRSQSHGLRDSHKDRSKGKINFSLPTSAFTFSPAHEPTESLPIFPFLSGSDSETISVGSKRSFDAVQPGANRPSHDRIGALTRKERRKTHGHAGRGGGARGNAGSSGMDAEMSDNVAADERERKRTARRTQ